MLLSRGPRKRVFRILSGCELPARVSPKPCSPSATFVLESKAPERFRSVSQDNARQLELKLLEERYGGRFAEAPDDGDSL